MEILPIETIHDEDAPLVGGQIVNLAKLKAWKFPVPDGLVVLPPEFHLRTVLKHYNLTDKEIFEQSLTVIKKETLRIPVPEELTRALGRKKRARQLWQNLLEVWLQEIRTLIWQGGFSWGISSRLSAQPVLFVRSVKYSGQSYYNPQDEAFDHMGGGQELKLPQREQVEELVKAGNRRLYLPQVYSWVLDKKGRLLITRLIPYTHPLKKPQVFETPRSNPSPARLVAKKIETVTKVFLDVSDSLVISHEADGFIIDAEQVVKTDNSRLRFDSQVFKIVETAAGFKHLPVIFKLSGGKSQAGGLQGALCLIHAPEIVKSESEAVLFARNQKQLTNVQLAVPFARSVHEFSEVKRQLAGAGLIRRGTLKIWLEMAVPENLIHLDDYLKSGCDGVVIDADELSAGLGGFDLQKPEESFYTKDVDALMLFLSDALKGLHQAGLPVIIRGNLALNSSLLSFLISQGVYGVVVSLANSFSIKEHLRYLERRVLH